jgi:hypothetical protein
MPMIKEAAAAAAAAAAAQRVKSVLRASFAGQFAVKGGQDNSERLQGDRVRWMREGGGFWVCNLLEVQSSSNKTIVIKRAPGVLSHWHVHGWLTCTALNGYV